MICLALDSVSLSSFACTFCCVRERSIDIRMRFASLADYWEPFLLGQGPAGAYAHGLTLRQLTALRGEIKRRHGISAEDRPIDLPGRVWAVRGFVPSPR